MKRTILFLLTVTTAVSCLFAQTTKNPFSELGYKKQVMYTSSKGEFEEFHKNPDVVEIGSVYFNTKTNKVIGYLDPEKEKVEVATATSAMSVDPLCEKYYWISPYAYCLNNPVNAIDPDGRSTWVTQGNNGTYQVFNGDLNDKDKNIYVYTKDKDGNYTVRGESIGITTSITSFYNSDKDNGKGNEKGGWASGSIINSNDKSGDNFLGKMFGNTPAMFDGYMANGGNGGKYDFKVTNGTDKAIPGIDVYRGMPVGENANGQTIYTSARDVGNMAAGFVAGANGMAWGESRIAFDAYQSKKSGRPDIEGISTRNAEYYGWRIGASNSTPNDKIRQLGRSITSGLKKLWDSF